MSNFSGLHDRLTRERSVPQTLPDRSMMNSAHNPNRSLIRIFCLSLGGLLAVYAILGVTNLFPLESGNTAQQAVGLLRSALALVAVGFLIRWSWFDERWSARSPPWEPRSRPTIRP
jgi:hypothetical protein